MRSRRRLAPDNALLLRINIRSTWSWSLQMLCGHFAGETGPSASTHRRSFPLVCLAVISFAPSLASHPACRTHASTHTNAQRTHTSPPKTPPALGTILLHNANSASIDPSLPLLLPLPLACRLTANRRTLHVHDTTSSNLRALFRGSVPFCLSVYLHQPAHRPCLLSRSRPDASTFLLVESLAPTNGVP